MADTKPKRPLSAYMIWLNEHREQIKGENPGAKVTEIAKRGGELWRELKDKTEWDRKAVEAKERYVKLVKEFEANGGNTKDAAPAAKKRGGGKAAPAKKPAPAKKSKKKADSEDEESADEDSD